MIHQPSGGAQGMASDIAIHAEEIIKLRARYAPALALSHSPVSRLERTRD